MYKCSIFVNAMCSKICTSTFSDVPITFVPIWWSVTRAIDKDQRRLIVDHKSVRFILPGIDQIKLLAFQSHRTSVQTFPRNVEIGAVRATFQSKSRGKRDEKRNYPREQTIVDWKRAHAGHLFCVFLHNFSLSLDLPRLFFFFITRSRDKSVDSAH